MMVYNYLDSLNDGTQLPGFPKWIRHFSSRNLMPQNMAAILDLALAILIVFLQFGCSSYQISIWYNAITSGARDHMGRSQGL